MPSCANTFIFYSPKVIFLRLPAFRKKCVLNSSPKPPCPGLKGSGVYRCRPPTQYVSAPSAQPVNKNYKERCVQNNIKRAVNINRGMYRCRPATQYVSAPSAQPVNKKHKDRCVNINRGMYRCRQPTQYVSAPSAQLITRNIKTGVSI